MQGPGTTVRNPKCFLYMYTGFVTGGVTPAALLADYLVSTYDQNVQVHLSQSLSTDVERHTIGMLCGFLSLEGFGGTITTGATAGNILGIACGRDYTLLTRKNKDAEFAGVGDFRVLCAGPHSSVSKACSVVGVGRGNVVDLTSGLVPASFDITCLERELKACVEAGVSSIIVATFGEVNTGAFTRDIDVVHRLSQEYGAWLHIDAAFGIMARICPTYRPLAAGLELADSISFDGHKFFNVPYDCGVFLTRNMNILSSVCGNKNAGYLSSDTLSPLNISLENSRRFRALPLYASLLSLGRDGYVEIVKRCCAFAKEIGRAIEGSEKFRLLHLVEFNIVLFQAKGYEGIERNEKAIDAINGTGKVYISGTNWKGLGALRIAVCNHLTPVDSEKEALHVLSIMEDAISEESHTEI